MIDRTINALLVFEQGNAEVDRTVMLSELLGYLDEGLVEEGERLTAITLFPYVGLSPEPDPNREPPEPVSLVHLAVEQSDTRPDLSMLSIGDDDDGEVYLLTRADLETLYRLIGLRIAHLP